MQPNIQFTRTSDGVRIAYMQLGAGKPVLYVHPYGIGMEPGLALAGAPLLLFAAATAVTTFDRGGTGASQRGVSDVSTEAQVRELEAVAGCIPDERFILVNRDFGSPGPVAYSAAHRERVELLVCIDPAPPALNEWPLDFLRDNWSMARRFMANNTFPQGPVETQRQYSRAVADSIDHNTFVRISEQSRSADRVPIYAGLRVPTLVIQRIRNNGDRERLQPIVDAIPDCNLILLDGGRGPEAWREEALAFFKFAGIDPPFEEPVAATHETVIIMFADIVDSTGLTERMGDVAFRDRARGLDERLRTIIGQHGGAAIDGKVLGDGVLAVFTAATGAIEAALACAASGAEFELQLHLGIHAGDVIREGNNIYGGAVNIASRIAGLSAPDELLVSDTVRSLARTSAGAEFEDRGDHVLKGVADAQRVYAVRGAQ